MLKCYTEWGTKIVCPNCGSDNMKKLPEQPGNIWSGCLCRECGGIADTMWTKIEVYEEN